MKYLMDSNLIKRVAILSAMLVVVIIGGVFLFTKSQPIEDGTKVMTNAPLQYFIKVSYDGVDYEGTASSDTTVAKISSNLISVEDTLPKGLIFNGFVETADGTIGGLSRDGSNLCSGYVVNDTEDVENGWNADESEYVYNGIHYDAATRKISYKVKDLGAGCDLTVGVVTTTPETADDPDTPEREYRMDFYNTARAYENSRMKFSNTVHAYIGDVNKLYKVVYHYSGDVPEGAPALPTTEEYPANTRVTLTNIPEVDGYTFHGWSGSGITNNSFVMPNHQVDVYGVFDRYGTQVVVYYINGVIPDGYTKPENIPHTPGTKVALDNTSTEELIDGYRFSGWTASNVTVEDGMFIMPNELVVFFGSFEPVMKNITYSFTGENIPSEVTNLLPETKSARVSTEVTLDNVENMIDGYVFSGWNHEETFNMPNENVDVTGLVQKELGQVDLGIESRILDQIDEYKPGDAINFEVTVTNNSGLDIDEAMINVVEKNSAILDGESYKVKGSNYAVINNFKSGAKVVIKGTYVVTEDEEGKLPITSRIVGIVKKDYKLSDGDHESIVYFNVQRISERVKAGNTMSNALPVIIVVAVIVILVGAGLIVYAIKKNK